MCNSKNSSFASSLIQPVSRRGILKQGALFSLSTTAFTMLGSKVLASGSSSLAGDGDQSPHYFLHIIIPFGLDNNYLFDARPLAMTQAELLANYTGEEPSIYTGTNGQSTFVTKMTTSLMRHKDKFSVLNGVVMSPSFEGHDQNMNMLLTGNPFGGDSYLPWHNRTNLPLDYLTAGFGLFANLTNTGSSLSMSPSQCKDLAAKVSRLTDPANPTLGHITSRAAAAGQGKGVFAAAARRLGAATGGVPELAGKLANIKITDHPIGQTDRERLLANTKADTEMLSQVFLNKVSPTGMMIIFAGNVDTHDHDSAAKMPTLGTDIADAIAQIFDDLAATPSEGGRSLLDDTTIVIGSEFSRTMRQKNSDFAKTGTDHNPLTNTIIVAGKGVVGGLVLGESDFATPDEVLSGAHLASDPDKVKLMGRPFNHSGGTVQRNNLMEVYDPYQYLTAINVTNTIQQILGIPAEKRFTHGRNLPPAAVIAPLIKS